MTWRAPPIYLSSGCIGVFQGDRTSVRDGANGGTLLCLLSLHVARDEDSTTDWVSVEVSTVHQYPSWRFPLPINTSGVLVGRKWHRNFSPVRLSLLGLS